MNRNALSLFACSMTGGVLVLFPVLASANLINVMASRDPVLQQSVLREVYSPDFLEQDSCLYAAYGTPLSVTPQTRDAVPAMRKASTQAEERARVHIRLYECLPYAMSEIETFIGTQPNDAKRKQAESLFREAKAWWRLANRFYTKTTVRTLTTPVGPKYRMGYLLADSNYAWSYSNHALSRLKQIAQRYNSLDLQHFSKPVVDLLTPLKSISGKQRPKEDMVVAAGQTFFKDAPSAEEIAKMRAIDRLHREASEALLCKLKSGNWCAGGRPAPVIAAEMEAQSLVAARQYGLPIIPSFARGVYGGLSYRELCTISQKIEHAHHAWTEGVIHGDTKEGFNAAWIAGLAHATLHIERRYGLPLHPSVASPTVPAATLLHPLIRAFVDLSVPGVGADGVCRMDFEGQAAH